MPTLQQSIKDFSLKIISGSDSLARELGSAKNYVCTNDLKHWTYGKSIFNINGALARIKFENQGYVNILENRNSAQKASIEAAFEQWTEKVHHYPILEKFKRDQKGSKRFILLVHKTVLEGINTLDQFGGNDSFEEGFKREIVRELAFRDKALVNLAKREQGYDCSVCQFNFGDTYGNHGSGFIEIHHLEPISRGKRKTKTSDLRPVCPNCHRMLHRGNNILSIEELKDIIKKQKLKKALTKKLNLK